MSFNQKSDVRKHLSARRHKPLLPFQSVSQSDIVDISRNEFRDENRDIPAVRQQSGLEFYAVTPIGPPETPVMPNNSADEPHC